MEQFATNDVFEAMGTARAMRWFRPDPVPADLVERLLWAATRAPSPDNTQPWDFVLVQDPAVRSRIGELFARLIPPGGFPELPEDLEPEKRRTRQGALNLLARMGEVPVLAFVCGANVYPVGSPDPTYMYSAVHCAAQNMIVAARALGLGAAFTTLHQPVEGALRAVLGIPEDRTLAVTIPIGWPARQFGPVRRRPIAEVVHHDRW